MSDDDFRYPWLDKVLQLAKLLHGKTHRPPLVDLANRLDVSTRTVIRYLRVLERNGWDMPPVQPRLAAAAAARRRPAKGAPRNG